MSKKKWLPFTLAFMLMLTLLSPIRVAQASNEIYLKSVDLQDDKKIYLQWEALIDKRTDFDRFEIKRNDEIITIENPEPVFSEEQGDGFFKKEGFQYTDEITEQEGEPNTFVLSYEITGWIGEEAVVSDKREIYFEKQPSTSIMEVGLYSVNDESITVSFFYFDHQQYQGASKYKILVDNIEVAQVEGTKEISRIGKLLPSTKYTIKVIAVDEAGKALAEKSIESTTIEAPIGKTVTFQDKNLENAIKNQLNIERDIFQTEIEGLTYIDFDSKEISNLTGIEKLINLESVGLRNNKVQDITPLLSLPKLTTLDISRNPVADSTTLGKLKNLTFLNVGHLKITDFTFIKNLTNLDSLRLDGNNLKNVDFLAGMNKLAFVTVHDNQLSKLGTLLTLENLVALELKNNPISDISGISALKKLEIIDLRLTEVSDISVLEQFARLYSVSLYQMPNLDLTENSPAMDIVKRLGEKGTRVGYLNPADERDGMLKIDKVTTDSISLSWNDLEGHRIGTININGDVYPVEGNNHTFTGLLPGTKYTFTLMAYCESKSLHDTVSTHTLSVETKKETESPKAVVVVPVVKKGKATVTNEDIRKVEAGGTFAVNLEKTEDKVDVVVTKEQIKELKDKGALLQVKNEEVTVNLPLSIFSEEDTSISLDKLSAVKNARSEVYDFTITQGNKVVSEFSEPVTLTFNVNLDGVSDPSNLKVFYFNEKTEQWENIGGTYEDGVVTAQTSHFSIYTVFESTEQTATEEKPNLDDSGNTDSDKEKSETEKDEVTTNPGQEADNPEKDAQPEPVSKDNTTEKTDKNTATNKTEASKTNELPNTATNVYTLISGGAILIIAATILMVISRRKVA